MLIKIVSVLVTLVIAPLLPGIINRIKAIFAGRQGSPLLQLYFDLFKLLKKGAVYSTTTTWVFRAGPIVSLASILMASLFFRGCGGLRLSLGIGPVLYGYGGIGYRIELRGDGGLPGSHVFDRGGTDSFHYFHCARSMHGKHDPKHHPVRKWTYFGVTVAALTIVIGLVESSMARLRMIRVPRLLTAACMIALIGMILSLR